MTLRVKSPTIKDVAGVAGVSAQTVSAVINDKPGITDGTRIRVRAAIDALGYRPFSVGRSLRTRKTRTLALVISDIANPSFATMASAAEHHAHANGYNLVVYNTHDDATRETEYIQTAVDRWIDGILFVSVQDQIDEIVAAQLAGIPTVAVDRIPQGYVGPSVTLDNITAGRMAVEHLLALGHRRIAHISGPLRLRLARERLMGYQTALRAAALSSEGVGLGEGNWECETGYRAMQQILQGRPLPTAVFAANDRMAIGAIRAAQEASLRVPEDLSFVGLDDIEVAAYQNPPLTTIRQSFAELATLGVRLLLDLVSERTPVESQVVVSPQLIVRRSTARIGA
jgi:LacI family transcriptional regulator